jgi:hypothetical protein
VLDQTTSTIMNVHMARNGQTQKQTKSQSRSRKQKKQPAPKETAEQKADREQKRAQFAALQLAKYGDPLAAIRAANPKKEIGEGSPYKEAREAWIISHLPQFDHWTSKKD